MNVMLNLLLTAIMIAALCGMVVCNRRQRKSTHYQLAALVLLVVVIASGGLFMCRIDALAMLGLDSPENEQAEHENKLYAAQGYVVANFVHNSVAKTSAVLLVTSDGGSAFNRTLLEKLRESGISKVFMEVLTVPNSDPMVNPTGDRLAESRAIDAAIAKHPEAKAVILSGISPSGDSLRNLSIYQKSYSSRPKIIVIGVSNLSNWVYGQLEKGLFEALVVTDLTKIIDHSELPENLLEVFNSRYVLITKDNYKRHRRFFH